MAHEEMSDCIWNENEVIYWINLSIFAISITSLLFIKTLICHVQHGKRRINKLTLRPWRIAWLTLAVVALKSFSNLIYMQWDIWFVIERLSKLLNIVFGMTLVLEKHIYSAFMEYQVHYQAN